MRTPKENFILASAELMRTQTGRRFFDTLTLMVEESRELMVFAPPDHIHYAQGVARQGTVLLRQMQNAETDAAKIIQAEEIKATAQRSNP